MRISNEEKHIDRANVHSEYVLDWAFLQVECHPPTHPASRSAKLCSGFTEEYLSGYPDLCGVGHRHPCTAHFRGDQRSLGLALGQTPPIDRDRHLVRSGVPGHSRLGWWTGMVVRWLYLLTVQLQHRTRSSPGVAARPGACPPTGCCQRYKNLHGYARTHPGFTGGWQPDRSRHP